MPFKVMKLKTDAAKFFGTSEDDGTMVLKKTWEHIKEKGLQVKKADGTTTRDIKLDSTLANLFRAKEGEIVSQFKLNSKKYLRSVFIH